MRTRRRVAVLGLLTGLGALAFAPPASAHALLTSSDPASGAQLDRAPEAVSFTFTEEPERSLSVVHVLDAGGVSREEGGLQAVPGVPRAVRVRLAALSEGVYTVTWRVVSRVDGHVTAGSFAFGVGTSPGAATPPASAPPPSSSPSILEVAGRWVLFGGFAGLIGCAWVAAAAFGGTARAVVRTAGISWGVALVGLGLLAGEQVHAAGGNVADFASTSLGHAIFWRALAMACAGVALVVAARSEGARRARRRFWLFASAIATSGAVAAHVAAGHAATGGRPWLEILAQWVHVVAAAAWVGGLAALLIGVRGTEAPEKAAAVRRFSTVAGVALFVVAGTGVVRAFGEIARWGALTSSGYGRVVLVKSGLLVVLGALGAFNRYRNVARAERSLTGLRRVGRAEVAVAGVVLGAAALLASISPPAPTAAAAATPGAVVVNGSDFGTTVRVRLEITPGTAGSNVFALRLVDYDTGKPVAADRVSLRFRFLDATGVGSSTLPLTGGGAGIWRAQGTNFSLDGRWVVTVVIERGADSREVPLSVGTRCVARPLVTPGQPTIYTVDLPGRRTAQLYVDPGRAGLNEIHVTFFDSAGAEQPVPELPAMTAATGDAANVSPPVRRFSAGHFVADAQLAAGRWRFAFVGAAPDGTVLRGCFEDTVR